MEEYTSNAGHRIEAMGFDVQNLLRGLGLSPHAITARSEGATDDTSFANGPGQGSSLLQQLRLFLATQPARAQELADLRLSLEELRKQSIVRNVSPSDNTSGGFSCLRVEMAMLSFISRRQSHRHVQWSWSDDGGYPAVDVRATDSAE